MSEWQPAILLPIKDVKCKLHREMLENCPKERIEQRAKREGQAVKIMPFHRGISLGPIRLPEGECYPVEVMDKDGHIAGAFSCEFLTD